MQARVHQRLLLLGHRRERGDQIGVRDCTIRLGGLCQCVAQAHEQVFMLVEKLLADFHLREQDCLVQILQGTRPFMLPRLLEIHTSAGTIESHLALLTTTLWADASVNSGTKAFFFSFFADRTTHEYQLLKSLSHAKTIAWRRRGTLAGGRSKPLGSTCWEAQPRKKPIFVGFRGS